MGFSILLIRQLLKPKILSENRIKGIIEIQKNKLCNLRALPGGITLPEETNDLFSKRKTIRSFSRRSLDKKEFLDIITKSLGTRKTKDEKKPYSLARRVFPSAGGLNLIEMAVYIKDIRGLDKGFYFLNIYKGKLQKIKYIDLDYVFPHCHNIEMKKSNFIVFLLSDLKAGIRKYGPISYKYALIECGHAAQNLLLMLEDYGMGGVCVGAFKEISIRNKFKKYPLEYAIICGKK